MTVTPLQTNGNSSKFTVVTKRGEFVVALSYTLRTAVWKLADADEELHAATELAEAIVSRHNPKFPFEKIYVFGEHNSEPTLQQAIKTIRTHGFIGR